MSQWGPACCRVCPPTVRVAYTGTFRPAEWQGVWLLGVLQWTQQMQMHPIAPLGPSPELWQAWQALAWVKSEPVEAEGKACIGFRTVRIPATASDTVHIRLPVPWRKAPHGKSVHVCNMHVATSQSKVRGRSPVLEQEHGEPCDDSQAGEQEFAANPGMLADLHWKRSAWMPASGEQ